MCLLLRRPDLHPGHRRAGREEHQEDGPQVQLRVREAALPGGPRGEAQGLYLPLGYSKLRN